MDKDLTIPCKIIDSILRPLRYKRCYACGLVDTKESFYHKIDEQPLCDYCFDNVFVPDKERIEFVKKYNECMKKNMNKDYLDTYEKVLFEE